MCNEIVYAASHILKNHYHELFLAYADQLATSFRDEVVVSLPPPVTSLPEWSSRAETLAHAYMEEGRAALWIAAREVVRDLDYEPDPRGIATGDSVRLGLYNKGGLVGLASATKTHSSICKLLNLLVVAIRSEHRWTSLSINRNCRTDVHKDQGNADEEHLPSMLIGLSHYADGFLWVQHPNGTVYVENATEGMLRGAVYPTSAAALLFHGQRFYHATMPWSQGDRIIVLAYAARQHKCALARYGPKLAELGFILPGA